jgi:hypothetical protein
VFLQFNDFGEMVTRNEENNFNVIVYVIFVIYYSIIANKMSFDYETRMS